MDVNKLLHIREAAMEMCGHQHHILIALVSVRCIWDGRAL